MVFLLRRLIGALDFCYENGFYARFCPFYVPFLQMVLDCKISLALFLEPMLDMGAKLII